MSVHLCSFELQSKCVCVCVFFGVFEVKHIPGKVFLWKKGELNGSIEDNEKSRLAIHWSKANNQEIQKSKHMGVSKNRGGPPKMDGLFHEKKTKKEMIWGCIIPLFKRKHPHQSRLAAISLKVEIRFQKGCCGTSRTMVVSLFCTIIEKYMGWVPYISSGGWTNPFEKYACQIGSFSQVGDEN